MAAPAVAAERPCTVISSDGKTIEMPEAVWRRIPTIRNVLDDLDDDDVPIPLTSANAATIKWLVSFYTRFATEGSFDWKDEDTEALKRQETVDKTIETFIRTTTTSRADNTNPDRLFVGELLNQLNFLDAGQAFDMVSRVFAELCTQHCGDDPVKIKAFLGIKDEA